MLARLKLYAIGVGVTLATLGAAYWRGRTHAEVDSEHEEMETYIKTRNRMDEIGRMSDADAAREWLRDRGKSDGDM